MTLPASGPISFNAINVELGQPGTTTANINQATYRTLAGIPTAGTTISLSSFYGKSNRVALSYTFSANTQDAALNVSSIGGYSPGTSDITITVNPSIYLWSSSTSLYGLNLSGGTSGDTIKLINNGFIMGRGGPGGGSAGGPGLNLSFPTTIDNTNSSAYIGGGGGGGYGNGVNSGTGGGGGGAGGAPGAQGTSGLTGGPGGGIGASGTNGQTANNSTIGYGGGAGGGGGGNVSGILTAGGGGGRIFPGAGGPGTSFQGAGAPGGGANNPGTSGSVAGGGGGWGASGGSGGAGGKAVNLNGNSVTWVSSDTARVYGSVS